VRRAVLLHKNSKISATKVPLLDAAPSCGLVIGAAEITALTETRRRLWRRYVIHFP